MSAVPPPVGQAARNSGRFQTLAEWLRWQETLHVREIDLGLARCQAVARRLEVHAPAFPVVSVAGTNGKGSSVAMLESILATAGYRVGCYSSPHLLRYNERIRVNREEISDASLCEAFERVEAARGEESLTYFEFGTLAALDIFKRGELDVAVLEVGMGGRLDAVNIVDADAALVATIDIDHVEWLGPDRESIGREKAGIMRRDRPAVCSDPQPPASLVDHARAIGAQLHLIGRDYGYAAAGSGWNWWSAARHFEGLPRPNLLGDFQLQNAAGVLMALTALDARVPVQEDDIRQGLVSLQLAGRFQVLPGVVQHVLDVAHNPEAAGILTQTLRAYPVAGQTHAIIGMLKDKDQSGVVRALAPAVDGWHVIGLDSARGSPAEHLATQIHAVAPQASVVTYSGIDAALAGLHASASSGDRILVTGSFLTVAAALRALGCAGSA